MPHSVENISIRHSKLTALTKLEKKCKTKTHDELTIIEPKLIKEYLRQNHTVTYYRISSKSFSILQQKFKENEEIMFITTNTQ